MSTEIKIMDDTQEHKAMDEATAEVVTSAQTKDTKRGIRPVDKDEAAGRVIKNDFNESYAAGSTQDSVNLNKKDPLPADFDNQGLLSGSDTPRLQERRDETDKLADIKPSSSPGK